jgi:2-oxoglutarate dehydrogenase E1 component
VKGKVRNVWQGYIGGRSLNADEPDTGISAEYAGELLAAQCDLPDDFTPHKSLGKFFLAQREEMSRGERPLNWAAAESIAFASLLEQGHMVRLSGQDSERGTFSQRHTVLHDIKTGREYMPLKEFETDGSFIEIVNSSLSENGILGFEYGYSLDRPDGLIMWEAQFGDFVNAAQVIIDQFISSAEDKWDRLSALVMLLPHGFEGQGPEHSSARLERFLQLCAEDNMVVAQPTTPAQYFHLLRRQTMRNWKKPLIVMTPKSLLRLPEAVSSLEDLGSGTYQKVIPDNGVHAASARRILLCSGKIYFELLERREETGDNVGIIRIEELYPVPRADLDQAFSAYPDDVDVVWVQEEPENMGSWWHWCARLQARLSKPRHVRLIARPESASPATGSPKSHKQEQTALIDEAFAS